MGNLAQNIASLPNAKASAEDAELQAFAAKLKLSLGASGVAIAHLSADPSRMVCVASSGDSTPPVGTLLDINSGISGRCISEDRMLDSYDTAVDPRVNREACERLGIRSLAVAPVRGSSGVVGVVEVFATDPGWFSREALARIAQAAEDVSLLYQRGSRQITTPARDAEAGREKRL